MPCWNRLWIEEGGQPTRFFNPKSKSRIASASSVTTLDRCPKCALSSKLEVSVLLRPRRRSRHRVAFRRTQDRVSLIVDRFHTVLLESPALDHFRYYNGEFELGSTCLYTMSPEFVWPCAVTISSGGRVVLANGGRTFAFGPGRSVPNRSGLPDFRFTPDPGDTVSLTVERSAIRWPNEPCDRSVAFLEAQRLLPPPLDQA